MRIFYTTLALLCLISLLQGQPANNNCNQAIQLNNIDNFCGNFNFGAATFDGLDGACAPAWVNPANVWFTFQAQGPDVTIGMGGPPPMKVTLVRFLDGPCNNINFLACASPGQQINFTNLIPDEIYYIIVSNEDDAGITQFQLCIDNPQPIPPVNDEPCGSILLNSGVQSCGTTINALQTFATGGFPCPNAAVSDVWYRFVVNNVTDKITLTITNGNIGGQTTVLLFNFPNGCNTPPFIFLDESSYCGPATTEIEYNCLNPGTYYVMVSTNKVNQGDFCIRMDREVPPAGCAVSNDCNTPIALPPLVVGSPLACIQGCNIGACGQNFTVPGCNYSGPVVWYSFTTPANATNLNLVIEGTGPQPLLFPQAQIFTQICGGAFLQPCQTGAGGNLSLIGVSIAPSTTYYVAVTNGSGEPGYFNICASVSSPVTACLLSSSINVDDGPYCPNEVVNFSYTFTYTSNGNDCQWPHAIIPVLGNCWDIDGSNLILQNVGGGGNWRWFDAGFVTYQADLINTDVFIYDDNGVSKLCSPAIEPGCAGTPLVGNTGMPAGWYWINQPGQCGNANLGDPNNTFGRPGGNNCTPGCNGNCTTTINFTLRTKSSDDCLNDPSTLNCGIKFYVFSDRQTGCWNGGGPNTCGADTPLFFNASLNCIKGPEVAPDEESICSGETTNITLVSDQPGPGTTFSWTVQAPNGVSGAFPGTGNFIRQTLVNSTNAPQTVIYLVEARNQSGCPAEEPTEIFVEVFPEINLNLVSDPADGRGCASTEFFLNVQASGGFGSGYTYNWSTGDVGPNLTVLPGAPGTYTYVVTVTDPFGCDETEEIDIIIAPRVDVAMEIDTNRFCRQDGPHVLNVITGDVPIATYAWTAPPERPGAIGNTQSVTMSEINHTGIYSVTVTDIFGCTGVVDTLIEVFIEPDVFFSSMPPDQFCIGPGDENVFVNFNDYIGINFSGGPGSQNIWTGSGTVGSFEGQVFIDFLQVVYGYGEYDVNLLVVNSNNCKDSISFSFEIIAPVDLDLVVPDPLCISADPISLVGNATPVGGVWSGSHVTNNTFDPASSGVGTHMVYYTFEDGPCISLDSMEISVDPPPTIVIDPVGPFCFDSDRVELVAVPVGGVWSGTGIVDGNFFDPSISGNGTFDLTYTYFQDDCTFPTTIQVVVNPEIIIQYDYDPIICLTENSVFTFTGQAPSNSSALWNFSGDYNIIGLNGFNAEVQWLSSGEKEVIIGFDLNLGNGVVCSAGPDTLTVTVIDPLEDIVIICEEVGTTFVTFSWNEVLGSNGYLVTYGGQTIQQDPGNTTLTVLDILPGSEEQVTITVQAIGEDPCGNGAPVTHTCTSAPCPDITLNTPFQSLSLCLYEDQLPIQLEVAVGGDTDGSGNGQWSGHPNLTVDGIFDPLAVAPGVFTFTYTYIEQFCTYTTEVVLNTFELPVPSWDSDNGLVCIEEEIVFNYTGTTPNPNSTITWSFQDGNPLTGEGAGPITVNWEEGGSKVVRIVVEDEHCTVEYENTVEIENPLILNPISCGSSTVFIEFFWDEVPGANGYLVTIDGGAPFITFDLNLLIDGLDPAQITTITITVQAIGTGVCGNSNIQELTCMTRECPEIIVSIDEVDPICLNDNAVPFNLSYDTVGSTMANTVRWDGPGVDPVSGIFNPQVAGVGRHMITIRLIEDFCPYTDTIFIDIIEVPTADFSAESPICINEEITATYTGTGTGDLEFNWSVDGAVITSNANEASIDLFWTTSGIKTIGLFVVDENGCTSNTFEVEVSVEAPLGGTTISCEQTIESINFIWTPVPGANGYQVTIDGQTFTTTDLSYLVSGLDEDESRTITIVALSDGPCGNGPPVTHTCQTEVCPEIDLNISSVDFICLTPATAPFNIPLNIVGGIGGGVAVWSGSGIINASTGEFDPNIAGVGLHTINLEYREGLCIYNNSIQIDIRPTPLASFTAVSPICVGQVSDIIFTGTVGSNATYNWTLGGGGIIESGAMSPILEAVWNTSGPKNIQLVVSENGCSSTIAENTVLVEDRLMTPNLSCSTTLTSIIFNWNNIAGNDGYLVTINEGNPIELSGINSYDFPDMETGDSVLFTIIALDNGPCGNSEADTLLCFAADCPELEVTINPIDPICLVNESPSITLSASFSSGVIDGDELYNWTGNGITNRNTGLFDPITAGVGEHEILLSYRVSVCSYQASTSIIVIEAPSLTFDVIDPKCFGINDGVIDIIEVSGGISPYSFSIDNEPFTTNERFTGLTPGEHTIYVVDDNNCTNQYTIDLDQPDQLLVDIGTTLLIDDRDIITLDPVINVPLDSILSYFWSGHESLTCIECPSTQLSPRETTIINLTITDINNCRASDEVTIYVRAKRRIYIPTAFSPNDDGVNDFFTIYGGEEVASVKSLLVFDRWGNMVFERLDFIPVVEGGSSDESTGWDGTFRGREVQPGLFVYHAVIEFIDGTTEDYYGEVVLLNTEK